MKLNYLKILGLICGVYAILGPLCISAYGQEYKDADRLQESREELKLPEWLKDKIAMKEAGPIAKPPAFILRCEYKSEVVYYLPPRCCDIPSVLWDEHGKPICSPDGGKTGRGDEKCRDFYDEKKDCITVWKDER